MTNLVMGKDVLRTNIVVRGRCALMLMGVWVLIQLNSCKLNLLDKFALFYLFNFLFNFIYVYVTFYYIFISNISLVLSYLYLHTNTCKILQNKVYIYLFLCLVVGSCLFAYGRRVGELCRRDSDCESGLVCAEAEQGVSARVCRPPVQQDKQYSEPCNMSSECDISRGLCCQLQRRHRQAPRKVSLKGLTLYYVIYFEDV